MDSGEQYVINYFDQVDADTVCRQLGYYNGSRFNYLTITV